MTITRKLKKTLLFVFFCVLLCIGVGFGCREGGVETIWTAEAKSPDGRWLAKAQTDQRSGFGTDGAVTAVYLQPSNGARSPILILGFSHNQNAQTSLIDLKMKWVDGKDLEVSYKEHASLDFQAVKYAGIDISVRDLSDVTMSSSSIDVPD